MSKEAMKLELARLQARTDTADLDSIAALNEALAEQLALQQEPYFRFRECEDSQAKQPAQRKPLTDAALHLKDLVDALDNAYISSWQSTADWNKQLNDARDYLGNHGIKE